MSHIFRHDIRCRSGRTAQHNEKSDELLSAEANLIAMGRNIISNSISLQKDAATVGPSFLIALAPSKEAPMERSASGVVRLPRVLNVF